MLTLNVVPWLCLLHFVSIQVFPYFSVFIIFLVSYNIVIFHYIHRPQFSYSPVNGHILCFQIFGTTKSAAGNFLVYMKAFFVSMTTLANMPNPGIFGPKEYGCFSHVICIIPNSFPEWFVPIYNHITNVFISVWQIISYSRLHLQSYNWLKDTENTRFHCVYYLPFLKN